MIANNILELIGNTPIVKINKLLDYNYNNIYIKLESFNPGGSVKDRAALKMIEKAEITGLIKRGDTIIEPTSGNTGIGIAMIGRLKGYRVVIVMPNTMSKERIDILKAYGAKVILTDGFKGMKGAIEKAKELVEDNKYFMFNQFSNFANVEAHYENTAEEILSDIPDIDVIISTVGTGGTISGIGKKVKEKKKDVLIVGVEPSKSPVLSGGLPGKHEIQGIGAGFIPKIYDENVVDKVITVDDNEALNMAKLCALEEGILIGISSGAALYVAINMAKSLGNTKKILLIAPDGGEKYLSTGLYD